MDTMGERVLPGKRVLVGVGWESTRKKENEYWGTPGITSLTGDILHLDGPNNYENGEGVEKPMAYIRPRTLIICR